MKIRKTKGNINPLGGINFVAHEIKKRKLPEFITSQFEERVKQAKYGYDSIILGLILMALCGGERLEDAHALKGVVNDTGLFELPSPDTLARILKSMSVSSIFIPTKKSGRVAEINRNFKLLSLVIQMMLRLGLVPDKGNTLDFDSSIIANNKFDAVRTYKKNMGYNPFYGVLNYRYPIYVEGRSGNTAPRAEQLEPIRLTIENLKSNGKKVSRFRADAASYQVKLMDYLDDENIDFFIRAQEIPDLMDKALFDGVWKPIKINGDDYEMTEYSHKAYFGSRKYRYVITRRLKYTEAHYSRRRDKYIMRSIVTNNCKLDGESVIRIYNQRGAVERIFELLNQFNTCRIPFSNLKDNTVYMIISMMAVNLYQFLLKKYSQKVPFVWRDMFLRSFIIHFMTVCTRWVIDKGKVVLEMQTDKSYEVLLE